MRYVRCINPRSVSMLMGGVYEVREETENKGGKAMYDILVSSGSLIKYYADRFDDYQPEVGDVVMGHAWPISPKRAIAEIDEKMFPNGKVGVRILNLHTDESEWMTMPDRQTLPEGVYALTCTAPIVLTPRQSCRPGQLEGPGRDLSHLDKTLAELLAEDRYHKAMLANEMAAAGPKLRPPVIGPERDPAFMRDQEAIGGRNLKIRQLREKIVQGRSNAKAAYEELVKLVGKEEADKV